MFSTESIQIYWYIYFLIYNMLLNIVVNMTLYKCYYVCILKVVSLVPFSLNVGARADRARVTMGVMMIGVFFFTRMWMTGTPSFVAGLVPNTGDVGMRLRK